MLALVAGLEALTLAIIVWCIGWHMPAATVVRRLALAVLALFGTTASLLTVLAVLDVEADWHLFAAGVLVGAAGVAALSEDQRRVRFASAADCWATGSAALAFAIFYRPFLGASPGRVMAQLSYSTDPANHIAFVQRAVEERGYLEVSDYPPAWSGNVAFIVDLVVPGQVDPTRLLSTTAILIVAFYALLVFFAVAVALDVLHTLPHASAARVTATAAACVGLCVLVGPGVLLLRTGSYTQILAMTALLAAASLLVTADDGWRSSITLGLLSVSVMQTWYLLAPVLAAIVLLYMASFRPPAQRLVVIAVPVALLSAYPLFKGPPPVQQINAPGGAVLPPLLALVALLFLTVLAVIVLLRHVFPRRQDPTAIVAPVVAALVTTTLVMSVQVSSGGSLAGYYSAKMLYVVVVFAAVATACAAGTEALRLHRVMGGVVPRRPVAAALCLVTFVAVLTAAAAATREWTWPFVVGNAAGEVDSAVLDAMLTKYPQGLPGDTDAWVANGCRPLADHIASKWIHDLFGSWDASRRVVNNRTRSGDLTVLANRVRSSDVALVELYVGENCKSADVEQLASDPKVRVVRVS